MGFEQREATDDEKRLLTEIAASLDTAMSVPPAADFLARVRARVAEERDRAATRWPASLSGASAAVAIALALIGAIRLGRVLRIGPDSGRAPTVPAASVAAPAPPPAHAVASVLPRAAASRRPQLAARVVGERPRPTLGSITGVLVDPGPREALKRLAEHGLGEPARPMFVIEALAPAAPLPELRPADLPRFEPKRLEMKLGGEDGATWGSRKWKAGGAASGSDEGSDS